MSVLVVSLVALGLVLNSAQASADDDRSFGASADDGGDGLVVTGVSSVDDVGGTATTASDSSGQPIQVVRAPMCLSGNANRMDLAPACINNDPVVEFCDDGSEALNPVWARTQRADGSWGDWAILYTYYCPQDAERLRLIEAEWASLNPASPQINMQPPNGWAYASMPTVVYVEDQPLIHTATILGINVQIRATPQSFAWNWGDGNETTTTDPGQPYPDYTVSYTYEHFEGDVAVELTTTWSGEYSVDGGATWNAIVGTISTSPDPIPLTIHNPKSRLVDCDLNGNCNSGLPGPSQ